MTLKKTFVTALACALLLCCAAAFAEAPGGSQPVQVFYTDDGTLYIETPAADWDKLNDSGYWFAMTNGADLITISRLNPEEEPAEAIKADERYGAVCNVLISRGSEMYDIRGRAVNRDGLTPILQAIASIHFIDVTPRTSSNGSTTGTKARDGKPFTVYGEDGSTVSIYLAADGKYLDASGETYDKLKEGLYCHNRTNMLYSTNADYWGEHRGTDMQDSEAFTVYAEDGSTAVIYFTVGGYYADNAGNTYSRTSEGLYSNDRTKVLYSADSAYWRTKQSKEETSQEETTPKEPTQEQQTQEQPAQEQPAQEQPAQEQPAQEQPAQEQPAQEQPAQEQPAQEQPTQEQPAQEQPAQEQPAQEQPAQEQPAQEQPAQEQPAQEQPAQEQPAQEKPAQEQPAQEQSTQEKPAQENPPQQEHSEPASESNE